MQMPTLAGHHCMARSIKNTRPNGDDTMTVYSITIPGRPVPKGRPRLGVRGRKAYDNELER